MKNFILACLVGGTLVGSVQISQAITAPTTFAQFNEAVSNKPFQYVGMDPAIGSSTINATTGVTFEYLNFLMGVKGGFHPTLGVNYTGTLTYFGSNSSGASNFDSPFDVTMYRIVADGSAIDLSAGLVAGTVLLSGRSGDPNFDPNTFANSGTAGDLVARVNRNTATFDAANVPGISGTQPQYVSFASDVINTNGIFTEGYTLGFTGLSNPNSYTTSPTFGLPYLNSFNGDAVGTFNAAFNSVPEPGAYALVGSLLIGSVFGLRRRRSRK